MGHARIYPWRKMHRSRAPSIAPGTFFVAQPWADCITNITGFNLRQAQPLDGSGDDHGKLLGACRTVPPGGQGSVLIIGESTNPGSQRRFAGQTPGAVTVGAVDLRDLV